MKLEKQGCFSRLIKIVSPFLLWAFILLIFTPFIIALYQRIATGSWIEITGIMPYVDNQQHFYRGKTLWDLLDLLIIPLALSLGVFVLNQSARKVEMEIANKRDEIEQRNKTEQQYEAALQSYLDKMTELMLENRLSKSLIDDPIRDVARARTLTVLRTLDGFRKGLLVRFLYESELISKATPIIDMRGADLSGANLSRANLLNANLAEVTLKDADLQEAILEGAELTRANLNNANMTKASLRWANLKEATLLSVKMQEAFLISTNFDLANLSLASLRKALLNQAIFSDANLSKADLREANLSEASFFGANLSEAILTGAKMTKTNLYWADLSKANLTNTNVSKEQLLKARSFDDTFISDKTK